MIQATVLLAAVVLTVTVSPSIAVDAPTCEHVRAEAKARGYTAKQIIGMAKRAGLTAEQLAAVLNCLAGKE